MRMAKHHRRSQLPPGCLFPPLEYFFLSLLVLIFTITNAVGDDCIGKPVPGEYLIRFNENALPLKERSTQLAAIMTSLKVDSVPYEFKIVPGLMLIRSGNMDLNRAHTLMKSGAIKYIVPNCTFQAIDPAASYLRGVISESHRSYATPNDPMFTSQWAHIHGNYDLDSLHAWNITTGSHQVVIGVVDTGVDYNHVDLAANMWSNPNEIPGNGIDDDANGYVDDIHGINTLTNSGTPLDDNGHGTFVAGILGAVGNNSVGVAGVNWNVGIMSIKAIAASGTIDFADAIKGFEYAIAMKNAGVNIVALNISWGGYAAAPSQVLVDSITALNEAEILVAAGAGNDHIDNDVTHFYPAGVEVANVISVAALDETGTLADFSNYGATSVDVAAPGKNIATTVLNNSYGFAYGTSMATPFVAGLAGLIASNTAGLTAAEIKSRIMNTVQPLATLNGKMVSPGVINSYNALTAGSVGGSCDDVTDPSLPVGDTDGDGVTDNVETTDGTNQADPGSFRVHLQSPVYALWTGFLDITNILELVNTGNGALSVNVALFSIDGLNCRQVSLSIPPGGQQDVILNSLDSFVADSYGLVRITYSGSTVDGRISYYRNASIGSSGVGNYDFVYSIPLSNPSFGTSNVSFNTFWPGTNPGESSNLVSNWLSIVNLANSTNAFTVTRYSVEGTQLSSSDYIIGPKSRVDIEGGHVTPGPNNVGLHVITPQDVSSPYLALITRYGHNAPPNQSSTGYDFAFPLIAKAGSGEDLIAPLTTTVGAQNWLEVINTTGSTIEAVTSFYMSDGTLVASDSSAISPHAQVHFDVNSRLGAEMTGYAVVRPSNSNSIIAQSMVYIRNSSSGSMLGMYGSQAREALLDGVVGSYNLYLGMYNWLKIINPSSSSIPVGVTVHLPGGGSTVNTVTVNARSSVDLGLHDSVGYGTSSDSYGVTELDVPTTEKIFSELLRIGVDPPSQKIDFAVPTEVR